MPVLFRCFGMFYPSSRRIDLIFGPVSDLLRVMKIRKVFFQLSVNFLASLSFAQVSFHADKSVRTRQKNMPLTLSEIGHMRRFHET